MDYFIDTLDVALRSITSLIFLFFITRLMGRKQISQLSFFDYVIGISIGSIAAEMATGLNTPYLHGYVSMGLYGVIATIISVASNKSLKLRRFINGKAYLLIEKGKILEKNLAKVKYDVNDLLSEARVAGYFNIADVEYAIMETSGRVSFLAKSAKATVILEDIKVQKEQETPPAVVIIDGKIMLDNLKSVGLDELWLKKQISNQSTFKLEEVFLGTVDSNDQLSLYQKTNKLINKYHID